MSWAFTRASSQYLSVDRGTGVVSPPFFCWGWWRTDASPAGGTIFSYGNDGTNNNYFSIRTNTSPRLIIQTRSSAANQAITVGTTEATEAWNFGLGVFASSSSRTAYSNLINTGTGSTAVTPTAPDILAIGTIIRPSPLEYMDGELAEVGLASGLPSHADIATLYANFAPGYVPQLRHANLVAYWPLLEDIDDHSGNGYHLSDTNGPVRSDNHPKVQRYSPQMFGTQLRRMRDRRGQYTLRRRRCA